VGERFEHRGALREAAVLVAECKFDTLVVQKKKWLGLERAQELVQCAESEQGRTC
jgi:hypothetical protein